MLATRFLTLRHPLRSHHRRTAQAQPWLAAGRAVAKELSRPRRNAAPGKPARRRLMSPSCILALRLVRLGMWLTCISSEDGVNEPAAAPIHHRPHRLEQRRDDVPEKPKKKLAERRSGLPALRKALPRAAPRRMCPRCPACALRRCSTYGRGCPTPASPRE